MNNSEISTRIDKQIVISNLLALENKQDIINEIFDDLSEKQKKVSSRFFYDQAGSLLFEKITALPEYYPTRTEKSILKEVAPKIMQSHGELDIIELGSGDCSKISILLDAVNEGEMENIRYVPVDVSKSAILKSAKILARKYDDIHIHGMLTDFMKQLKVLPGKESKLICFLGSTLGNISRHQADKFLENLKSLMRTGDRLILGLDMVKDINILESAYNDKQGVTKDFNKNILHVINEIAETDFNTEEFKHLAFYDPRKARIEMHLKAVKDVTVSSPYFHKTIAISKGETIHTENSHKFTEHDINRFAKLTGMEIKNIFTDIQKWFSLVEFGCVD